MGLGHVPPRPVPQERARAHLPRRERRGAGARRARAAQARRDLGAAGEAYALAFLKRRGARPLARNVRSGRGEIDLIVDIDGLLVAVEVKTRFGEDPIVQITREKLRRMAAAARRLSPRPGRIDVITVLLGDDGATIRWVKGVV